LVEKEFLDVKGFLVVMTCHWMLDVQFRVESLVVAILPLHLEFEMLDCDASLEIF
jgi:hypothetical protein